MRCIFKKTTHFPQTPCWQNAIEIISRVGRFRVRALHDVRLPLLANRNSSHHNLITARTSSVVKENHQHHQSSLVVRSDLCVVVLCALTQTIIRIRLSFCSRRLQHMIAFPINKVFRKINSIRRKIYNTHRAEKRYMLVFI